LREVAGSDHDFRLGEFAETMRSRLVSVFSDSLATSKTPLMDTATRYVELGDALLPLINPVMRSRYGLQIVSFVVENVSVPPEVEEAIDRKSSMAAVGDLNDYVKFQLGRSLDSGGAGPGALAAEMAVGLAVAQQMMPRTGVGAPPPGPPERPELMTPHDVALALGVPEVDVMAAIAAGELKAKRIGSSWRLRRADLDAYLDD
jgi:excisionase family DNA binding protein